MLLQLDLGHLGRVQAPEEHQESRLGFRRLRGHLDNFTIAREDVRRAYGEKCLVTFGLLGGEVVVVLVYTERRTGPHIISLRKAEKYETRYYFAAAKDYLEEAD